MDSLKRTIRDNWNHHAETYDEQYQHGLKSSAEKNAWMQLLRTLIPEKKTENSGCRIWDRIFEPHAGRTGP